MPATKTWRPSRTAREKPIVGSYGEPEETRRRSIGTSIAPPVEAHFVQIDGWPASIAAAVVLRGGERRRDARGPRDA